MREAVGGAAVCGVVKADAYGHGAVPVGLELERLGIDGLAVARIREVEELRAAGCVGPLLLFGGVDSFEDLRSVVRLEATPVLCRRGQIAAWVAWLRKLPGPGLPLRRRPGVAGGTAADRRSPPLDVVVELDTGMSRSGLNLGDWPAALEELRAAPELRLTGLMSHLAESDFAASSFTGEQERRFAAAAELLDARERRSVSTHLANSSAALRRTSNRWSAVRVGGTLYGLDLATLAAAGTPPAVELRPVMSVRAPIVDLRRVPAGAGVGYGRTWRAPVEATIGLVPVGYGDGFSTGFGGGDVLVRGMRCPIAGRISMDSLTVDVTGVPGVAVGDECVLLGSQGSDRIDVGELAARAGVAPYEVWCGLNRRLPRTGGSPQADV